MRFRPPALPLGPDVAWALLRALAPVDAPVPAPPDGEAAVGTAAGLGLAGRIGTRVPVEVLTRDVGEKAALTLWAAAVQAEESGSRLARRLGELGAALAGSGPVVAVLKFAALLLRGKVTPGLRTASDLDLLAAPGETEVVARVLAGVGFARLEADPDGPGGQAHALLSDGACAVEVHEGVAGVRVPGWRGFATLEALRAAGLAEPVGAWLCPTAPLLAAHAIAHGVAQHGFAPAGYPLLRMVADVADLGLGEDEARLRVHPLLASDVSARECLAVVRLARRLTAGDASVLSRPAEGALVRHVLAARSDPAYLRSLRLRYVLDPLVPERRWAAVLRGFRQAAFPPPERLRVTGDPEPGGGPCAAPLLAPPDAGLEEDPGPGEQALAEAALLAILGATTAVRLTVTGNCMAPALLAGEVAVLVPPARQGPRWGDVVLARLPDGVRLHRLVWAGGGRWRTKGDRSRDWDPPLGPADVLATVTAVGERSPRERWFVLTVISLLRGLRGSLSRLLRGQP